MPRESSMSLGRQATSLAPATHSESIATGERGFEGTRCCESCGGYEVMTCFEATARTARLPGTLLEVMNKEASQSDWTSFLCKSSFIETTPAVDHLRPSLPTFHAHLRPITNSSTGYRSS